MDAASKTGSPFVSGKSLSSATPSAVVPPVAAIPPAPTPSADPIVVPPPPMTVASTPSTNAPPMNLDVNGVQVQQPASAPLPPDGKSFMSSLAPSPDDMKPSVNSNPVLVPPPPPAPPSMTPTPLTASQYPSASLGNDAHNAHNDFPPQSNIHPSVPEKSNGITQPTPLPPPISASAIKAADVPPVAVSSVQITDLPVDQSVIPPSNPVLVPSSHAGLVMKKFLIPAIIVLIVVFGFIGSLTFSLLTNAKGNRKVVTVLPTAVPTKTPIKSAVPTPTDAASPFLSPTPPSTNPFVEFAQSYTNPFGSYDNPFATDVQAADNPYTNPFDGMK